MGSAPASALRDEDCWAMKKKWLQVRLLVSLGRKCAVTGRGRHPRRRFPITCLGYCACELFECQTFRLSDFCDLEILSECQVTGRKRSAALHPSRMRPRVLQGSTSTVLMVSRWRGRSLQKRQSFTKNFWLDTKERSIFLRALRASRSS